MFRNSFQVTRTFIQTFIYTQNFTRNLSNRVRNIRVSTNSSKRPIVMASIFTSFMNKFSSTGSDEDDAEGYTTMTRHSAYMKEKERLMHMPIEEKRTLYKCRKKFVELSEVPTWSEYFKEDSKRLLKLRAKNKSKESAKGKKARSAGGTPKQPKFEVNEDFNNKVSIWCGDITCLEIDAIVNAANNSLLGGGGVDGAIHSAAGSILKMECSGLGGCNTGDAKITSGYKLPAKHVIHTVGPIGFNPGSLESCYVRCFQVLTINNLRTIALPCISTGIYGYPNDHACETALANARCFLETGGDEQVDRIIFCLFLPVDVRLYEELMQIYFPVSLDQSVDEGNIEGELEECVEASEEIASENQPQTEKNEQNKAKTTQSEVKKSSPIVVRHKAPEKPEQLAEGEGQESKGQIHALEGEGQVSDGQGHLFEGEGQALAAESVESEDHKVDSKGQPLETEVSMEADTAETISDEPKAAVCESIKSDPIVSSNDSDSKSNKKTDKGESKSTTQKDLKDKANSEKKMESKCEEAESKDEGSGAQQVAAV